MYSLESLLQLTASLAMLNSLASDHRRVVSDWRALVLLRRATFTHGERDRRWSHLPHSVDDVVPYLRQMTRRGELEPISGLRRIYQVTVPYARLGPIDEIEVLFEANPFASLSHISALVIHGFTNETPKSFTAMTCLDRTHGLLPLDTEPADWEGIDFPGARTPSRVLGRPVIWSRVRPDRFYGMSVYEPGGFKMRVTSPERTLVDATQEPELCGGMANVLTAWVAARHIVDVDSIISIVDRYGVAILRQRVGYILDQLGLGHPRLDEWMARAHRGGSSKLVGSEPFETAHDDRWNLSLNGPVWVLRDEAA